MSNSVIYLTKNLKKTISHPKEIQANTYCLNCHVLTVIWWKVQGEIFYFLYFLSCTSHLIKTNTNFFTFKTYYLLSYFLLAAALVSSQYLLPSKTMEAHWQIWTKKVITHLKQKTLYQIRDSKTGYFLSCSSWYSFRLLKLSRVEDKN